MLFILFQLGTDRYALPAADLVEVLPLVTLKAIPGAPRGVAGLMDYRGAPVPVIDLSLLTFGVPAARRVSTRVLMARYPAGDGAERRLGLVAERATEMLSRAPEDFRPVALTAERMRFLGPVTRDERGLIQRVEAAELLDDALRTALFPETRNTAAMAAAK